MADDLNEVVRKMLHKTNGQGRKDYKFVTCGYHISYNKWCNHQRADSTNAIFKVMGQLLGMPMLLCRTHELFEKSLLQVNY